MTGRRNKTNLFVQKNRRIEICLIPLWNLLGTAIVGNTTTTLISFTTIYLVFWPSSYHFNWNAQGQVSSPSFIFFLFLFNYLLCYNMRVLWLVFVGSSWWWRITILFVFLKSRLWLQGMERVLASPTFRGSLVKFYSYLIFKWFDICVFLVIFVYFSKTYYLNYFNTKTNERRTTVSHVANMTGGLFLSHVYLVCSSENYWQPCSSE